MANTDAKQLRTTWGDAMAEYSGPHSDVRILEIGGTIAGAFCGKLLTDFGAEVLKIEPLAGDETRSLAPLKTVEKGAPVSGMHLFLDARKRSLTLDVTKPSGREIFRALLAQFDAVIDSRPFVATEDDELLALRANAAHVVWLRITPFGLTGPWREWQGDDLVYQAVAGGMYGWGSETGAPLRSPGVSADFLTGAWAAAMVTAPLRTARAERQGQLIDVSQAGSQLLPASLDNTRFSFTGAVSYRVDLPFPGIMACADGFVGINLMTDEHWRKFCGMVGQDALTEDARFSTPGNRVHHAEELFEIFGPIVLSRTKGEFFEEGNHKRQIPISPVSDPKDVMESEHLNAREYFVDQQLPDGSTAKVPSNYIRMSDTPFAPVRKAPELGEHTLSVLTALGVPRVTVDELRQEGVV